MTIISALEAPDFGSAPRPDAPVHTLLCFSHLRWQFVFQRPQHLISRFAQHGRVIFWEEPEAAPAGGEPALAVRTCAETGVVVVTPSLPAGMGEAEQEPALRVLLDAFLASEHGPFIRWYYTPMMLPLHSARHGGRSGEACNADGSRTAGVRM